MNRLSTITMAAIVLTLSACSGVAVQGSWMTHEKTIGGESVTYKTKTISSNEGVAVDITCVKASTKSCKVRSHVGTAPIQDQQIEFGQQIALPKNSKYCVLPSSKNFMIVCTPS